MNLNILALTIGILGQAIIIAGYLLMGGSTPGDILWLNIVVTSIVFWLLATSFGLRPINLSDPTQKQAGGLGLRWFTIMLYSILAIGFIVGCGIYTLDGKPHVEFSKQIVVQLVLFFLLLVGFLSSYAATQKTGQVYHREQNIKRGKVELKYALADLSYLADSNPEIPAHVRATMRELADETRYITPSDSLRANELDERIFAIANRLRGNLRGPYELNRQDIEQLLPQLRIDLQQRKQFI